MKKRRGFTLIEVLVDVFVITAVFGALIGSFILILRTVGESKVRTAAAALANEQIEKLRNLPYDDLSTQNGTVLPHGNIPDNQTVIRSGISYNLETIIIFVDDPFDGCAIPYGGQYMCTDGAIKSTIDPVPVDYKRITVRVTKLSTNKVLANLTTTVAAKAAETSSNTGILIVIVNNAAGQPVPQATVSILNTNTGLTIDGYTNNFGIFFVANVPPDTHNGYHIETTKAGYSRDFTTSRTAQNPNQTQPDVSVYVQQVTTQTLVIDLLSDMMITALDPSGSPISSIEVTATSSKTTQFNPVLAKNVYLGTTNASGIVTFSDIEWDSYAITVPSNYNIISTSPYQKVGLSPDSTLTVYIYLTTDPNHPIIEEVAPINSTRISNVEIEITGKNFTGDTAVILRRSGYADITPTSLDVQPNQKSISAVFDLAGKETGNWDIVINAHSQSAIQIGGFTIL